MDTKDLERCVYFWGLVIAMAKDMGIYESADVFAHDAKLFFPHVSPAARAALSQEAT